MKRKLLTLFLALSFVVLLAGPIFAEENVTFGRVQTIIDHITRNGNPELSMSRTGEFLRELVNDIVKEHDEFFKDMPAEGQNAYNRAMSTLGRPMWQKEVEKL